MAGEIKSGADGTVSFAPRDRSAVEQKEGWTIDQLQKSSVWQSNPGLPVRKPFGEPLNDLDLKSTVVPGAENVPANEPIVVRQFPKPISEQIRVGPQKEEPAAGNAKLKDAEERTKLVEKLGKSLKDQELRASAVGAGTVMFGMSMLASKVYAPLRIGVGSAGVITSVYNGIKGQAAAKEATAALRAMPKVDAERFGKHQDSMQLYSDITGGAYITTGLAGGLWATGFLKSAKPIAIAGLGVMALDAVNTSYFRPKAVSNFHADFEAWKFQMKK